MPRSPGRSPAAETKARLEDLYAPFKVRRRTKAQSAREAGLGPLAEALLARPEVAPEQAAERYAGRDGFPDLEAVLEGARAILIERFGEDAELVGSLREDGWRRGRMRASVRKGKAEAGQKFADYFAYEEPLARLPPHRILALFRGEKEAVLDLDLTEAEAPGPGQPAWQETRIARAFGIADRGRPGIVSSPRRCGRPGGRS